MKRLTKHSKQTSHENGICCTHFRGTECLRVGGNCAMNCKWEEAAWSRLAAYEDTGLYPESVEALKLSMMGKAISEITEFDGLPIDRLRELAEAGKDGRVMVLPCKPGDTVYMISWRLNGRHEIEEQVFSLTYFDPAKYGKDYFLSREEAEKALEAMKDE